MAKSLVECANDQASENRPLPIASARSCPSLERENAVRCHSFRAAPLLASGLADSLACSTTKLQITSGTTAPRGRKLLSALNSFGSRMGMSNMSAGRSRRPFCVGTSGAFPRCSIDRGRRSPDLRRGFEFHRRERIRTRIAERRGGRQGVGRWWWRVRHVHGRPRSAASIGHGHERRRDRGLPGSIY